MPHVHIMEETTLAFPEDRDSTIESPDKSPEYLLCFQKCRYVYDNGEWEAGYRFIWRRDGRLLPHRGQARIPSIQNLEQLVAQAKRAGWENHKEDE